MIHPCMTQLPYLRPPLGLLVGSEPPKLAGAVERPVALVVGDERAVERDLKPQFGHKAPRVRQSARIIDPRAVRSVICCVIVDRAPGHCTWVVTALVEAREEREGQGGG